MQHRLWLIGGTQESAQLARAIARRQIPCVVTVTTESARSLYPLTPTLYVWVGRMTLEQLPTFLAQYQIRAVLDASHPFAVEISRQAMAIAQEQHIPYLRYERPDLSAKTREETGDWIEVESVEALFASQVLSHQRVLLVLGYRLLGLFQPWQERTALYARILPSQAALSAALASGFTPDRLIALRPPISAALERALWQQWQITMVVAKASGTAGGEDVKRRIAKELGVRLVTITRPSLTYPQQTSRLEDAVDFCDRHIQRA